MDVDVAVLGGGPGGYPAAIRASQLGLSVALIEQGRLGGTCLNVGCIPTKALVQSAHAVKDAHTTFAQLGVKVSGVEIDWPQMQANKQSVVDGSVSGLGGLLKANGVNVIAGPRAVRERERARGRGRARASRSSTPSSPPARGRCGRRSRASTTRAASTRPACSRSTTSRSAWS